MRKSVTISLATAAVVLTAVAACRFAFRPTTMVSDVEETSVYVNIEEKGGEYLVFCCFNAIGDFDPMSVSNRRKAAALTIDALCKYRNLPQAMTVKVRSAKRDREPERNGGILLYRYRIPVASCEDMEVR